MKGSMTQGNPLPQILKFTLPLFLGNVFQQFYNMVDSVIVGKYVGPDALGAVGATGTVFFLIIGLANGMTTGYTVLTSQKYGANNLEGAKKSFGNGIVLSIFTIIALTFLSVVFMHPILKVMNTPDNIYADAYSYIITIAWGIVALVFYNFFAATMRAIGDSRTPLFFLIFSALLNIVLDLVFIVKFNLGTMGAALATDLSQGASAVLCCIYIFAKVDAIRPKPEHFRPKKSYIGKQLWMGIPMGLQFGITASGTMVMQAAINMFGSVAVTGFTAASKVQNLMTQGMLSLGQTMAAYSGQNYGYGSIDRVDKGTKDAMKIAVVYSITSAVLCVLLLPLLMGLFFDANTDIGTYMPYARIYVYESVICYVPLSMIFVYRNTMQGCGYSMTAMMLGVMELVARLITAFLSMAVHSYPLAAGADPMAWITAGVVAYFLYKKVLRKLREKMSSNENNSEGQPA
ncbi:MAG: MATE family efflux transporter [Lachnospiraceae bacterium]|nr:MATE family efflux transporter [Lachnospiraceae bacterium]